MQMPRFGMKSVLILFAVVGLWLSTFTLDDGAQDVQFAVKLAIILTSSAAAFSTVGARRAYWGGFSATMFVLFVRATMGPPPSYTLGFWWSVRLTEYVAKGPIADAAYSKAILATTILLLWLGISAAIGLLCSHVYSNNESGK
jgi:hypothetical protein